MIRKILCFLLAALTILSLAACTEQEYEQEYVETTDDTKPAEKAGAAYGDAIRLMMKTFDNSFTKEELYSMFPEECWTYFETENGTTPDDIYTDFSGKMAETWKRRQEEFGPDAAVKYEILDRTDYTESEYIKLKAKLEKLYGISTDSFGICYEVKVKKATIGSLKEDIYTSYFHVLEINGNWYVAEVLTEML